MKIFILQAGLVVAVCVLLLWPALFNGQYFWFTDSVAYLSGASRAVLELLGLQNELGAALNGTSNIAQAQLPSTAPVTLADPGAGSEPQAPVIYGGRSPYYGLLLYLPTFFGSLWLSVMLQVAAVIVCIATALRPVFGPGSLHVRLVLIGLVAALTSVSFFTVYLMPDIFLAILILSIASLVAFWSDHSRAA